VIGADLLRAGAFLGAAAGDDHRHVEGLAELDGGGADPAGAAVNQDRLTLARPAALEHIVPDGEERFRDSRRLIERQARGHRQAQRGIGQAIVGIAAARHQRADLLAQQRLIHALAQRDDFARNFQSGNRRGARRRG
jgi:hypothetical protein